MFIAIVKSISFHQIHDICIRGSPICVNSVTLVYFTANGTHKNKDSLRIVKFINTENLLQLLNLHEVTVLHYIKHFVWQLL